MEAIAYVCNLGWTDHPNCVDPFLVGLGIFINDHPQTTTELRNSLIPLIPKIVNTDHATPETKLRRRSEALRLILHELLPWWIETAMSPGRARTEQKWYGAHVLNEPDLRKAVAKCEGRSYDLDEYYFSPSNSILISIYRSLQEYLDTGALRDLDIVAVLPVGQMTRTPGALEQIIALYAQIIDILDPELEEAAMQAEVVRQIASEEAYKQAIARIVKAKVPAPVPVEV